MNETTATLIQTIADNQPRIKEEGKAVGRKEEHKAFWDSFQSAKSNFWARYAGSGWNTETFRPKNDLNIVNGNASYCFAYTKCRVDMVDWCNQLGINIDIKPTVATGIFQSSEWTRVPVIDTSLADSLSSSFAYCSYLVIIDKLILKDDGSQAFANTFYDCKVLRDITIEGVIGKEVKLVWSPLLSNASITSFINHLSTTTSGVPIIFSKTAVDNAFETSEGAADGSTSAEWLALVNTRKNWTISLH